MNTNMHVTCAIVIGLLTSRVCGQKVLHVLHMMPSSYVPLEVRLAYEDINNSSVVLHNYTLTYERISTYCKAGLAVFRMTQALTNNRPCVMVLGPTCSVAAEATAEVTYMWNLTQISASGTSPVLSDRQRFPKFYRMGSPDYKYNMARLDLMKKFNWRKIATIHQATEFFSEVTDRFIRAARADNVTIISQQIFLQDPTSHVRSLKAQDARIVYVAMYETQAKYLLCAAFNIGFYGPKIVWMFPGWYARTFWMYGLYRVNCSAQNMSAVVEGSFMFSSIYQNPVEERGPANLTVAEFYDKMRSDPRYWPSAYEFAAGRLYDHVWLVAVALNCTINRLTDLGYNKSLDEFTYRDGDINQLIYDCMGSTSMVGIAGRISFETGDPDRIVSVERIQGGEQELIAYYRQDQTPSYYEWQDGVLKWKDGLIPRDSTYVVYEELLLSSTVYICMCNLAAIGILLALAFLAFNIYHRRNRGVQRSAPNINIILLLGCVLCYATAFFKSTDTNNATVCTLRVTTFTMGMTVTVGSLFSKTWLVHKFLTKSERQDWRVNDLQLLSIIGLVVAVVTVILITWEAVAPHHIVIQYLQHQVYTIGNDVEVRPFVRVCHSEYTDYFSWAIYIIEGALLSLCAFLSFETRHVRVLHLNDSRQFGMCVYNAVLLSLAGLVLSLLLTQEAAMLYGITSGCLIIGATVTQLLVFVPKMTSIYHGVDVGDDDTDLASTNPPHAASSGFRVLSTHS